MRTRAYYENEIMRNMKEIPEIYLPEFYNLFNTIKDIFNKKPKENSEKLSSTGLCGIWKDDRDINEIIADMESGRNYFSDRTAI